MENDSSVAAMRSDRDILAAELTARIQNFINKWNVGGIDIELLPVCTVGSAVAQYYVSVAVTL